MFACVCIYIHTCIYILMRGSSVATDNFSFVYYATDVVVHFFTFSYIPVKWLMSRTGPFPHFLYFVGYFSPFPKGKHSKSNSDDTCYDVGCYRTTPNQYIYIYVYKHTYIHTDIHMYTESVPRAHHKKQEVLQGLQHHPGPPEHQSSFYLLQVHQQNLIGANSQKLATCET